jgi:RNA polymerase sigma factor (sigma-70 family)
VATVPADAVFDDALVAAMRDDLDEGFTRLVERYAPLVISVAARVSGRRTDAEDLAAETFLRAYRALRGYSDRRLLELRVRPWLVTIALNLSRNTARDRSRRPMQAPITDLAERRSASSETAELALASSEREDLARRLSALSTNERAAVVLRHVVEMPVAEIAEVLGCKEVTARSHIARGLAHLRASYGEKEVAAPAQQGRGREEVR